MINSHQIVQTLKQYWLPLVISLSYISLSLPKLSFYTRFDFNFILLAISLPFCIRIKNTHKSFRYGIGAIILFLLYPFVPLSTIYFFGFIFSLLFIIEQWIGKITSLPLILLTVSSPIVIYLTEIAGFEIRLYLTEIATAILSSFDNSYSSIGNIIKHGDIEFRVDPSCMGLKMVMMSLILPLVFIAYFQNKRKIFFSLFHICLTLFVSYILVIIANLFRIVLITLLEAYPETITHEAIGIICFSVYVILPIWFYVKWISQKHKPEKKTIYQTTSNNILKFSLIGIIFSIMLIYKIADIGQKDKPVVERHEIPFDSRNFSCSLQKSGVMKMSNDSLLIYIKPSAKFFSSDHSPFICWKGSGYKIKHEQQLLIGDKTVLYCILDQNGELLNSCWWYDGNKNSKTSSQFAWRLKNALDGEDFQLINVISYDKEIMENKAKELLMN